MFKNKTFVTILLAAALAGAVFFYRSLRPDPAGLLKKRMAERSKGDPASPHWITEYFDYQCPPCSKANTALHEYMEKNPGKVYLQVRYYPLPSHKFALKAAVGAECAARQKGKFWRYHDILFSKQQEWSTMPYPEIKFAVYAEEAGLDLKQWDACFKDPAVENFVKEEKTKGAEVGVKITPSFFVDGKMVVGTTGLQAELDAFSGNPAPAPAGNA